MPSRDADDYFAVEAPTRRKVDMQKIDFLFPCLGQKFEQRAGGEKWRDQKASFTSCNQPRQV